MFTFIIVAWSIFCSGYSMKFEHSCSRFHYEEKTLEKLIRLQIFVEEMKSDLDDTQAKVISKLSEFSNQRDQENVEFKDIRSEFEQMKATVESEVASMKKQVSETINAFEEDTKSKTESTEPQAVAFKSQTLRDTSMTNNKSLTFARVLQSVEGIYNTEKGVFTVPVSGVYIFTAQLCTNAPHRAYFAIYRNEEVELSTLVGDTYIDLCSTMEALVVAYANDQISVRCRSSCDGVRLTDTDSMHNTFSGVLVQKY